MTRTIKVALALTAAGACAAAVLLYRSFDTPNRINVVLIVIDTLGFRHLQPYFPEGASAPNLQRLAERGVVFTKALSPSPWTKPAVASLFTGEYPSRHGLLSLNDRLPSEKETLAESLKQRGYRTKGVVSHTLIDGPSGYDQGFESYELVKFKGNVHDAITSQQVTDLARGWLQNLSTEAESKPFFLFAHYFDPHYNYQHHPDFNRTSGYTGRIEPGLGIRKLRGLIPTLTSDDIEYMKNLYREEISYTDKEIGRLLDYIDGNVSGETIVIVTADHGEEFMEHGYIGHTRTLYDELIHVPFIIASNKRFKPSKIDTPVSTLDTVATLRELLGTVGEETDGISLVPFLTGAPDPQPNRNIFSEVDFESSHIRANKVALSRNTAKVILDREKNSFEYIDLSKDPLEKAPVAVEANNSDTSQMVEELKEFAQKYQRTQFNQIKRSPKEIEQLKSLGYIQ